MNRFNELSLLFSNLCVDMDSSDEAQFKEVSG